MKEVFEKIPLANGITLYLAPTDRFKAITLKAFIHLPLDEEVTANALLVRLLSRGCKKYPNMRKMVLFLESLYGASFASDVDKIGERHILEFRFDTVAGRYLPKRVNTLQKGLQFLYRILTEPVKQNGGFKQDYLAQEKDNLKHLIETLVDDKIAYARQRCIQEMCREEPYRLYEYGRVEDLAKITPKDLLDYWYAILKRNPIDIFILGQISPRKVEQWIRNIFTLRRGEDIIQPPLSLIDKAVKKPRLVRETSIMEQSKLVLGFRTYTTWSSKDIFSLMVANGILGSYPHSKLFQNVREKAGLAYYARSILEKTKGLMIIHAGIDHQKFDQALGIIKQQVEEIKQGNISSAEFTNTVKSIEDQLKAAQDSPSALIDYTLEQLVNNRMDSLEMLRQGIRAVKPSEVAEVAQRIKLDTIYFLSKSTK